MNVPNHIAIILDGNGRWAKAKGMPRGYGHIKGCANLDAAEGKRLLETFMKSYRDPQYVCSNSDVVEEAVFQKRVEFWGEGLTFFDVKRLNMSVTRGYPGTNFFDTARLNTNGRPAWMNMSVVRQESDNNAALVGFGNPDPTDFYIPWVETKE